MTVIRLIGRHAASVCAVVGAWGVGHVVEAVSGLPAAVAGLLVLAVALTIWPTALRVVAPTADIAIRVLPLLFVPVAIAGAVALADSDAVALAVAVGVSVPVGFVVTALLAR